MVTKSIPRYEVSAVRENFAAWGSFSQLVDEHFTEISTKLRRLR